ncbi:MAG TPA: FG-GAP-like repeat-containing protein [Candidatus Acidoferrum sp.]
MRLSTYMLRIFRPALSFALCSLLACPPLPAQDPKNSQQAPVDKQDLIKPDPKQAKHLVEAGEKMEQAGDLEHALKAYEQAAAFAPFDVTIVNKASTLRSKLLQDYVKAAEGFAAEGNFMDATVQLANALRIDPDNALILQRMQQLANFNQRKSESLPDLPPEGLVTAEPQKITKDFNLRTDVRGAYEQVAASYGLKASFDPDLPTRNVRLRLDSADFATAMKVLSEATGTFWRALSPTLIFVASDTADKRKAYDPQMEETFVLPSSVDSADITELVRVIRELTGAQHIQQSIANHTLTVRDSVEHVHLAGAILNELEQARGEVLLEIDLLEVDRTTARNLGITPPARLQLYTLTSSLVNQLRSATDISSVLTLLASVFGTSALTGLPAVALIGGGKSTFLLGLPTFTAHFADALNLVHSGRQVLLRAQDNKPATFFVGERYPITLSLLSASLGTSSQTAAIGGTSTTISTQQFNVGAGPVALATADFRGIGSQDLAVLNELDNTLTILLNQGNGVTPQFAQATGSPVSLGPARTATPAIPASLATASLNPLSTVNNPIAGGDNLPDLLVVDPEADTVTVYLQTSAANGTFILPPKTPITVGKQPSAIATGTFNTNNNSNIGFVVTNFADNTYSVYNGNGDGTFTPVFGSPFPLPSTAAGPYGVTVADFNGDGKSDLAILNQTTSNVTILEGNGDGTFQQFPNSPIPVGKFPVAITSGSLIGSTGPALAVVNQNDNTLSLYFGNGDGTFVASPQSPLATNTKPSGVIIGSFGTLSGIAVTNTGAGTVTIFADLGTGHGFGVALETAAGSNPGAILSGSFTFASSLDIVVANNNNTVNVPVQVTLIENPATFIAGSGAVTQQPYPGSQYEDIGIKVKATPNLHANNEVTLQLEFEIKALAGTNVNGIPVITNRTLTQSVRLKENETSLIGGLLDQQETKTITGIPGLAELPGAGYAFGSRSNSTSDSEFLILVTPRKVRLPLHEPHNIYAGRGDATGRSSVGTGSPLAPPPTVEPNQPENQQPAPTQTPEQPPQQPAPAPAPEPNAPQQPAPELPNPQNQPGVPPQPPPQTPPQPQP